MTFAHLYSSGLTRELGNEDASQLFTTARRQSAINEGMQEFADLTECLQRQSTITITGGTAEYNLNSTSVIAAGDFVRLSTEQVQVRYVDASSVLTILAGDNLRQETIGTLNRYTPGWQDSTVASTTMQLPEAFYTRTDGAAFHLGFYPVPSTGSSATMTAIVPYIAQPQPLTSDTQEPFATASGYRTDLRPYHQALIHYGAAQLEKLRRDMDASAGQLQMFMGYVQRYRDAQRKKTSRQVLPVARYFGKSWGSQAEDPRR